MTLDEVEAFDGMGDLQLLHCSQDGLDPAPWVSISSGDSQAQAKQSQAAKKPPPSMLGEVIMILAVVGLLGFWFLPGLGSIVLFIVVVVSAILAAVECSAGQNALGKPEKRQTGPVGWAMAILVLYLVAIPCFLQTRAKWGHRPYGMAGFLIMLVFLGIILLQIGVAG